MYLFQELPRFFPTQIAMGAIFKARSSKQGFQNKDPAGYRGNLTGLVNEPLIWFIRSFRSGFAISSIAH
ncbi:hypothetical protein HZZ13_31130 [Bradyrhizobium sp. CNPSo 4010]|uniref:Uncharacterized protein n=1 Tax=Bradyrhizobium agreste TaxID=2751811 RepID=A0ABS0PYA6_9BRAD|nr:hypothetical protein [Bradyrhizobium agreste]MBH5402209.1 hypothetical protein [Bradyrhizobium agreste]